MVPRFPEWAAFKASVWALALAATADCIVGPTISRRCGAAVEGAVVVDGLLVEAVVVAVAVVLGGVENMPKVGNLAEDGGHVVEVEVGDDRVVAHVAGD